MTKCLKVGKSGAVLHLSIILLSSIENFKFTNHFQLRHHYDITNPLMMLTQDGDQSCQIHADISSNFGEVKTDKHQHTDRILHYTI